MAVSRLHSGQPFNEVDQSHASQGARQLAPKDVTFVDIPIGDLPLYNHDFDTDYPPTGRALKDAIAAVDAVLFVTPEYNRGIPGRTEERYRLGKPSAWNELIRA